MISRLRSIFGRFWYLFVAGIMLFIFITIARRHTTLSVYDPNKDDSIYTIEKETEEKVEMYQYDNPNISMTMQIPVGWEKVTKSGHDTFVHSASASSIQIQLMDYYPQINNTTAESIAADYYELGYSFSEFNFTSSCSYDAIYTKAGANGITDYIERTMWDRQHVLKVIATFQDSYYEKLKNEVWSSLDSISWFYEDPITDGFFLYYQQYGDIEFAVPNDWIIGDTGNGFFAYDEGGSCSLSVNTMEDTTPIGDISQLDYANFLAGGRQNFILNTFQQQDGMIYGEATYTNNNVQFAIMQYYMANGTFHYILTYEYPTSIAQTYYPLFYDALAITRVFYGQEGNEVYQTQSTESSTESQTESEEGNQMVYTPGETELTADNLADVFLKENEKDENVSSFADALVNVADIPVEKAQKISEVWDSLGAGIPTYAEGYAENDTSMIILVQNSLNVDFYVYITKEGDLMDIRINTEDGQSILN